MTNGENVPHVVAVDDNEDALYALKRILLHNGYQVTACQESTQAVAHIQQIRPDIVLLDIMMPQLNGYQIIENLKADFDLRFIPVILVSAKSSLDDIIKGLDTGADDYIIKPFRPEELLARLRAALRTRDLYRQLSASEARNVELARQLSQAYDVSSIVGESPGMQSVLSLVKQIVDEDAPVLITGPSGTGKELIARAVHFNSQRRAFPFVAKNCAAFSESLLESELFGHTKGAFTGATEKKQGLFRAAHGGTLFLDEIGEMSQVLQAKLLRVLQEGRFMPVGSVSEEQADVRVVAATNRDLSRMVEKGEFREDLFYRLNVLNVDLPPLKDRPGDVALLAKHFVEKGCLSRGIAPKTLSAEVLNVLQSYSWKGNVRELENEIERMLILGRDADELTLQYVSDRILNAEGAASSEDGSPSPDQTLKAATEQVERKMILETLNAVGWNKSDAARKLGVSRSSLLAKIQAYGLEPHYKSS